MSSASVTRGHGLLEGFLARKRCAMANFLIAKDAYNGRILDIGCGSYPLFLSQTSFREKTGIDQVMNAENQAAWRERGIDIVGKDLDRDPTLPFPDNHFDVVTMLAVFEHIEPDNLRATVREIHRVLKSGGIYILTTPAHWTDAIIATLSWFGLLSSDEIDEHEETHTHGSITAILTKAGFDPGNIECGTFECGMNLWARAKK